MKKSKSQPLHLKFNIQCTKKDGTIQRYSRRTKTRVLRNIEANFFEKAYLKVEYLSKVYNHGTYYAKQELKEALNQFTEKELLEDIASKEW